MNMFRPITSLYPGNSPMREVEPIINCRTEAQKISKIAQVVQFPSLIHFPMPIKMEANQAIYFYSKINP